MASNAPAELAPGVADFGSCQELAAFAAAALLRRVWIVCRA